MYLKDVVSKHLIKEGPEFDDDDVNNRKSDGNAKVKSFAEEQEELKREFLKEFEEAANVEDDEERDLMVEFERNEELKHLKNLKKKGIKEKLQKIREVAGIGDDGTCLLDKDDLEEEFDPEEYNRKMKEAFGNKYYDTEDVNPEFGSDSNDDAAEYEKPDFDEENRLLGLANRWNEEKHTGDGLLSARQRILESKLDWKDESDLVEDEESPKEGDLKTRFKYKPVKSKRFGLSTEEILILDDKELNQYASLKKLAPYREMEWKVPLIKTYQQKLRNKALLEGETSNTNNKVNNKTRLNGLEKPKVVSVAENEKSQMEESNGDTTNLSRRSKRRNHQAELKLSRSRLMAYGKIHSKSKSKMH
ncbi:unnamed protein product [Fraxinus pennsylvanica]|uniref:Kri1-like C-terminal domain-containing protein n=1 Tax=Fraxinus pennsylvanica TaxID=56036 RepID=A0AAD2AEJ6_9LAMI|nr:unnamed protein product [Fraxinus pennsylvanica]